MKHFEILILWLKKYSSLDLDWNEKTGLTIQIQNLILTLDCQSDFNPPYWIAIQIEQSSNTCMYMKFVTIVVYQMIN